MTTSSHGRRASIGVAFALCIFSLAGCASAGETPASALTLADSKSSAQLVRNDFASHVDLTTTNGIAGQRDVSMPCKSATDDPEELFRSWRSTLFLSINAENAERVLELADALVASFTTEGWEAAEDPENTGATVLTKPNVATVINIDPTEDTGGDGNGATIHMTALGPCVVTGGAESDEVMALEESAN